MFRCGNACVRQRIVTRRIIYITSIVVVLMFAFSFGCLYQLKANAEETYEWIQPYSSAKYCVTEVNHVVYCYFLEDCLGGAWLGTALDTISCENQDYMRVAGVKTQSENYLAGELVAIGINLEKVENQDEIQIVDSLLYQGNSIPVTKVELEQFAYAFSTAEYKYLSFNILSDSIKLCIGKNVTNILFGDTVSIINAYKVDEGNASYCSADGVIYGIDLEGHCSPINIPDRYNQTSVSLPDNCLYFDSSELIGKYKYDALYPVEYSMGYLASEYLTKNYIKQRTYSWKNSLTLEEYLTRVDSLFLPLEITDPNYTNASVLVLYGDIENHAMYDEIIANEEVFIKYAFYRKGYMPSSIKVDKMSYKDLVSYDTINQYDFIFIESDTYNYFGETQFQIIHDASINKVTITYAESLESLEYADLEENIIYDSVKKIFLPNDLELDVVTDMLIHQKELFPNLTIMRGENEKSFYQMNDENVLYAEDEESIYYIGITTNNENVEFHLNAEKNMYIMNSAFNNVVTANIYIHAPLLYLEQNCFVDYSLATDDVKSNQEIYVSYDNTVYQYYHYVGTQAEFPTVGTADEAYEYVAEYELIHSETSTEEPPTEAATEQDNADIMDDTSIEVVESITIASESLSMKPLYYLNSNNIGKISRYKNGKSVQTYTLDRRSFSYADQTNADKLLENLIAISDKETKVFIVAKDTTYNKKQCKKYKCYILESGLDSEELKRALNVMNCKYFQYLQYSQCYYNRDTFQYEYKHNEEDLEVFHKKTASGGYAMKDITYELRVSDWEISDTKPDFKGWVYGIQFDKFMEYYEICEKSRKLVNDVMNTCKLSDKLTVKQAIDSINNYVRIYMAYDDYYEIADLSWALKYTDSARNEDHKVYKHGMCSSFSRLAFAVMAECGYEVIPCMTWKSKHAKEKAGEGPVHSVSMIMINGKAQYCDFCWSSSDFTNKNTNRYMYLTEQEMNLIPSHYGPKKDNVGKYIYFSAKGDSSDTQDVVTITFDPCKGNVERKKASTDGNGKLNSFPTVSRREYCFLGWYTKKIGGTKVALSKIYKQNTTLYAHWEKAVPKKVKGVNISISKDKIKVSYDKISGVDGYELQYSTTKKFTTRKVRSIICKGDKNKVFTIKYQKRQIYYFKIRAYRIDSTGRKVYGKWSVVKKK